MLDIEDYNMGLKYAYTKTEGINNKEAKLSVDQVLELFKRIDKKIFMEEDYEDWNNLPEEITIYRGTPKGCNIKALSWTLDENRAIWFYKRYYSKGNVCKAKIRIVGNFFKKFPVAKKLNKKGK